MAEDSIFYSTLRSMTNLRTIDGRVAHSMRSLQIEGEKRKGNPGLVSILVSSRHLRDKIVLYEG